MNLSPKPFLIAEIGINHNGDYGTALKLIDSAISSKVGGIKFQYRNLERSYGFNTFEIGDEILKSEITRSYLSPEKILELSKYAKAKGTKVGISFFDVLDISDFGHQIEIFDFFKIPSVEATNIELISRLLNFKKFVYISTGAHQEEDLEKTFSGLPLNGWMPLHCVSNYPTIEINAKLGYIKYLAEKWDRPVGYSSHDVGWETCLVALSLGAMVIERHITLDKEGVGLDHSTSSTPDEFLKLSRYISNFPQIVLGNHGRSPNQGELINKQNLGKSFFARRKIESSELVKVEDFDFRHPSVGISKSEFESRIGKPLLRTIQSGRPLTFRHFEVENPVENSVIDLCNSLAVSLPVRLHDYSEICGLFPLQNFELHLSFEEVEHLDTFIPNSRGHTFSIHLPDYQSPTELFNPFSLDKAIKDSALHLLEKVALFGEKLLETQNSVILVSSLSIVDKTKEEFYLNCKEIQTAFAKRGLNLAFQWLPPFAWYFGGSEPLYVFNSFEDLTFIRSHELNICLDTSHLLMGAEFFAFDPGEFLEYLRENIIHFHLADARGYDGEGYQLGQGSRDHLPFLLDVLQRSQVKVIEVWQGHLNMYSGFEDALNSIAGLHHA